jgi:hypothetical protein
LCEARSTAHLLVELKHILSIDKYQHQTGFSSSKPGIRISTSSTASSSLQRDTNPGSKTKTSSLEKERKSSINLLLKNNHEQDLWYTVIIELWSGVTIANEQCDIAVLNKASRHIALIDALANMNYCSSMNFRTDQSRMESREKLKQRHNEVIDLFNQFIR